MNFEQEENIVVKSIAYKICNSVADETSGGDWGMTCNLFQKPVSSA